MSGNLFSMLRNSILPYLVAFAVVLGGTMADNLSISLSVKCDFLLKTISSLECPSGVFAQLNFGELEEDDDTTLSASF